MARDLAPDDPPVESDRVPGAPHPRETPRVIGQDAAIGSFMAAGLPLLTAVCGVGTGIGLVYAATALTDLVADGQTLAVGEPKAEVDALLSDEAAGDVAQATDTPQD